MNETKTTNSTYDRAMLIAEMQRGAFRKYQVIPLSIVLALGFISNVMVLFSGTRKNIRKKYSTNSFIISLAVADLGVVCYFIPLHMIEYTIGLDVSDWTCKYVIPIRETFVSVSIFTVADLSMVRWWQIHSSRVLSRRFTYLIVGFTWVFAYLAISLPISFVIKHTSANTCDHFWKTEKLQKIHVSILNTLQFIPLLITTICYASIIRMLKKSKRRHQKSVVDGSYLKLNSNELGILLMLIITAWWSFGPFLVYSMLTVLNVSLNFPFKAWSAIAVFLTSSSAINPVLVLVMYKDYRKEILRRFYKKEVAMSMLTTKTNGVSGLPDINMETKIDERL